ncbi:hypothetical protein PHMEG_0008416 [Phytophthora megakarya]|uniref:Uncharacterized protein n=1 Tax=Phytophthora megakarya TaxID=4795 RepID=A0A225WKH2_9STRA|nr:hypothetical protein PHMEG_0008416 [Phytophthora megakarya]
MDVQLVFWERGVTKELGCVNVDVGCPRCRFESFLRGLVLLKRRGVLHLNGAYAVDPTGGSFARLRLQIEGMNEVAAASELQAFELVQCHLQHVAEGAETEEQKVEAAKRSRCHVIGCMLHRWKASRAQVTPEQPPVRPVTMVTPSPVQTATPPRHRIVARTPSPVSNKSLVKREREAAAPASPPLVEMPSPPAEVSSPIESSVCLKEERRVLREPLPGRKLNLPDVFHSLMAHIEAEPTDLWSEDIAGLDLRLYEHQRRGLSWMVKRERGILWDTLLLNPFSVPGKQGGDERELEMEFSQPVYDVCGGMLCDEPGLGKTITMLALILLTRGQSTQCMPVRVDAPTSNTATVQLRPSAHGRSLRVEDLLSSRATLIVAPDALVEHWAEQIDMHVLHRGLKTYVDNAENLKRALPSCRKLVKYDVVIVPFSRMAKEWKLHRPPSAMEMRRISRYGFEDQADRFLDGSIVGDLSSLLSIHWLRVVVDEGHKLGGRAPTQLMQMSRLLCAERRWVMTGTPSPNTLQSADLLYIHGLLAFLRSQPYGRPDGYAWLKAIARPFERNEIIGFYRLQHLLSRIMIRHTKYSIRDILPYPIRHTVIVDPMPSEFKLYNVIAEFVQSNLVITSIDLPPQHGDTTDKVHSDSLLNRKNRHIAGKVENDLTLAYMGGYAVEWTMKKKRQDKIIAKLRESGVNELRMSAVIEYLNVIAYMDARMPKQPTECRSCHRLFHVQLVLSCGHLCCAECAEKRYQDAGPSCCLCHEPYSREGFKALQPDMYAEPPDDKDQRRKKLSIKGKKRKRADTIKKTVRLLNLKRDFWRVESSKIFYMATRIRELMKEFSRPPRRHQDELKVIIFSQHRESIWRTKVAFSQQDIPTADFIALINPQERIKNLEEFRSNPDVHVLLLSNLGSHGLDLSFVTHIFLLEEIWDKSVEQQVISRAHRMGAKHSVVVEQLWMRGTVECQLTSNGQLFKSEEANEDRESTQSQPTREEVQDASSADKNSFQQMKINYILSNLRVLNDDMCGKDGEVRFAVMDEVERTIRQGVHSISESGNVTTMSTMQTPSHEHTGSATAVPPVSPHRNTAATGVNRNARNFKKPMSPDVIVIDGSSSDEHKSDSDSEDNVKIPPRQHSIHVKEEPDYIEIMDEDTESETEAG